MYWWAAQMVRVNCAKCPNGANCPLCQHCNNACCFMKLITHYYIITHLHYLCILRNSPKVFQFFPKFWSIGTNSINSQILSISAMILTYSSHNHNIFAQSKCTENLIKPQICPNWHQSDLLSALLWHPCLPTQNVCWGESPVWQTEMSGLSHSVPISLIFCPNWHPWNPATSSSTCTRTYILRSC